MGRHSTRTPEIDRAILSGLKRGVPLAVLCRKPGTPSTETWRNWCLADDDLDDAYYKAREIGARVIDDRIEELLGEALENPEKGKQADELIKLRKKWMPWAR